MAAAGGRETAGTESGVQAGSSAALLARVLLMAVELVIRTSVLVVVGRHWSAFDGPATGPDGPETAQERSSFSLTID
jgi:hypothetical protein